MPDLNLGPTPETSRLRPLAYAVGALGLLAAALFYFNPHQTATASAGPAKIYVAHTETAASRGTMNVIGNVGSSDDDLYVAVPVTLTDKLRLPIFIKDETAVLTAADGSIQQVSALPAAQLAVLPLSFPAVQPILGTPLARNTEIAPAQTVTGTILLHFPHQTDSIWRARKSAILTIDLAHQSPLILSIPQ